MSAPPALAPTGGGVGAATLEASADSFGSHMFDHSITVNPSDAVAADFNCHVNQPAHFKRTTIMDPYTASTRKAVRRLRFPWFRRVLAPFGLVSTVIIVGVTGAALTVGAFMGLLFIVEQAVG